MKKESARRVSSWGFLYLAGFFLIILIAVASALNVQINSPADIFYNNRNILINITLNESGYCEYSLDGGNNNITLNTFDNLTFTGITSSLSDDTYFLNVYCNDSFGIRNDSEFVNFSIDTTFPKISFVFPTENNGSIFNRNEFYINASASDLHLNNITIYLYNATGLLDMTSHATTWLFINYSNFPDGTYYFNASADDSAGNLNWTEERTITIDTTPPIIIMFSIAGDNDGFFSPNGDGNFDTITMSVTANEVIGNWMSIIFKKADNGSIYKIYTTSLNAYDNKTSALVTWNGSLSAGQLKDGLYNISVHMKDLAGNKNLLLVGNISVDLTAPLYSNVVVPAEANYSPSNVYNFNITWNDASGVSKAILNLGGKNYSMSNNSNEYYVSISNIGAGNYSYYFWASDYVGNANMTGINYYTINKASQTAVLNINETSPITYGVYINVTCNGELFRNEINITNQIAKSVIPAGGNYNYSCKLYENENYTYDDDNATFIVNRALGSVSLLLNGENSDINIVYGDSINASASTPYGTLTLYRNGINALSDNNKDIFLRAGYYNYSAYSSGNENYTGASITRFANISKAIPSLNLTLSRNSITYPEKVLVNGSGCPSQLNCTLYKNNLAIANPTNTSFSGGNHDFVYNTTGNENYTSATTEITSLVVNKGTPAFSYYLNSQTKDVTLTYPQKVNASAYTNGGVANIFRNGVNVNNETGQNISLGAGSYAYKFNLTGNENWTDLTGGTINLNVNRARSQCLIITSSTNLTYGDSLRVSASCNNPETSLKLYRNGNEVTSQNNQHIVLGAGSYNYIVNVSESQNYTRAENNTNIIVNKANGLVYGYINGERGNATIYEHDSIQLDGFVGSGVGTVSIYKNSELLNSAINEVHNYSLFENAGLYNITFVYDGNENYTPNYETWFVNVLPDSIAPRIIINYPEEGKYYNSKILGLYYEAYDRHLDKCWYSLNLGVTNSTIVDCSMCFINLDANEGNNTWRVYARDMSGNIGFAETRFIVDTIPPVVVLNSPAENESYNNTNNRVPINLTTNENGRCFYAVDGKAREGEEMTTTDNRTFSANAIIPNGKHIIYGKCFDLAGNSGETSNVSIMVWANSPSSSGYYIASGGGGGSKSNEIGSDYIVSEENLEIGRGVFLEVNDKIKFMLNGQPHYLILDEINGDAIKITIMSNTIELEMNLGETKIIDVDGEGIEDISVKFDSINNKRAEIYIQKISPSLVRGTNLNKNSLIGTEKATLDGNISDEKDDLILYLLMGIGVLIVLAALLAVAGTRRKMGRR